MNELYCPTCRQSYPSEDLARPPYAVVHLAGAQHLHPITRRLVARLDDA